MPPPVDDGSIRQVKPYPYNLASPEPYSNTHAQSKHNGAARTTTQPSPARGNLTPNLEVLKSLPVLRSVPWREGQEPPPDKGAQATRVQQREAVLLAAKGKVIVPSCDHCARGCGRLSLCIALENVLQGACASCIYRSKGANCSLRTQKSGTSSSRTLQHRVSEPDIMSTRARAPTKKRKRQSAPATKQEAPDEPVRNHTARVLNNLRSPDMDSLLQTQIANDESTRKTPKEKSTSKKQKSRASYPEDFLPYTEPPLSKQTPTHPPPPTSQWTSTQPPSRAVTHHSLSQNYSSFPPVNQNPDATRSSKPVAANWPIPTFVKETSTPVIDSLPKAKQRQVYGLISGLQGGIDHLEKQLNSLKSVLGIADDDDELQS